MRFLSIALLLVAGAASAEDVVFQKSRYYDSRGKEHRVDVILTDGKTIVVQEKVGPVATIPFQAIEKLSSTSSYNPSSQFPVGLDLFLKEVKHWLDIEYKDPNGSRHLVLRLDKSEYADILATIKARTGKDVGVPVDDRAKETAARPEKPGQDESGKNQQSEKVAESKSITFRKSIFYDSHGEEHEVDLTFRSGEGTLVVRDGNLFFANIRLNDISWLQCGYSQRHRVAEALSGPTIGLEAPVRPIILATKEKKHWLYVSYNDSRGTLELTLRLDKSEYDEVLNAISVRTGKAVEILPQQEIAFRNLVLFDDKGVGHEADLIFAGGQKTMAVQVRAKVFAEIPLDDISSLSYSHSRHHGVSGNKEATGRVPAPPVMVSRDLRYWLNVEYKDSHGAKKLVFQLEKSTYEELLLALQFLTLKNVELLPQEG